MSRRRKSSTSRATESPNGSSGTQDLKWFKVDLHTHTPASHDYEQPQTTYLEWLREAAKKELDVVAITDHNTVAGVDAIRREVEWLTRLEETKRLNDEEKARLAEWRELTNRVLVLPGFEFTATFGFHILGIFPPEMTVRELEYVLLQLGVPADKLQEGATVTGANSDVLAVYKIIREAGGLAIAAHANSTHGVAMRNFPFGGQTKIAYTQDENLDALEVTDLEKRYRSTARFFNGSKAEYPRQMHCIQGSDAHRLTVDAKNAKRLGIGERATEMKLPETSFEHIAELLRSDHFERTRIARAKDVPFDAVALAREEGPNEVQSLHETASQRGGRLTAILADVCAFANTQGGTVYVGVGMRKGKPKGLEDPKATEGEIRTAMEERFTPAIEPKIDTLQSEGKSVLRIEVKRGTNRPYCLDDMKFYVRDDADTSLAVRDEIVALVREVLEEEKRNSGRSSSSSRSRSRGGRGRSSSSSRERNDSAQSDSSQGNPSKGGKNKSSASASNNGRDSSHAGANGSAPRSSKSSSSSKSNSKQPPKAPPKLDKDDAFYLPQVGVEIVDSIKRRGGAQQHSVRDLRNGRIIQNVTRQGARKLWSYAIQQHEEGPADTNSIKWRGDIGVVHQEKRAGKLRYDLALRENGDVRIFYGVTEDGMDGPWSIFLGEE